MLRGSRGILSNLPRSSKAGALGVSVVLSAALTAVVLRSADHHWLAWISFLPLFVAVRWLRAPEAALVGGLWGACLALFSAGGPTPVLALSAWLLALLIVIPAVYVGLAARPARAIGFNLLTLALGWTLVEACLHLQKAIGPREGVLTGAHVEGPPLHWLAGLLGYVSMAFLVAWANASLVSVLSEARLSFPAQQSFGGLPNPVGWLRSQVVPAMQSWTFRQAFPRAPPLLSRIRV